MFKIIKDKIDEEFNPVLLNQLMLKSIPKLEEIKGKDLVLFIGALGAGKSTTINMLLGQNFKMVLSKYKNNKGKVVLRPALIINNQNGNLKLAKMGHIDQSETLYPEAFKNVDKSDIYYCDWPGFRDTRGTEARLAIFLAKLLTIQYARSIRGAVIVIDYETERNKVLRLQKHHIKDAECLEEFMKKDYAESSIFIVNCRLQPTEFDVNTFRKNFSSTYGVKKKNVLFMTPEIIKSKMELAAFRKRMLRKLGKLKVVKKE
ncbi:MAG: 50S ribosome-binding GTPase, partial [Gammaproteobacteria bacterium]